MILCRLLLFAIAPFVVLSARRSAAEEAAVGTKLNVPAGFSIELVAGSPLVERPITASFDEQGRLYVAESSGSNDPVEKQLELKPHRIVRLEDTDGDGTFDRRVVFADRMMFPAGTLFHDGSLYVSAPPSIWKLTDTNGDGVADERIEWFQGKTLTHCANDLHGPYLGPDGWIYWCKGAFAEQTHVVNGKPWTTRASHIFRSRPDGSGFEPVITAGMDNPVDVAFTPEGERILSATYLVGEGRRDGMIHAVYGGVYGKEHGVLDGHPRTGELMPALVLMSPTAPSGLESYDSDVFGEGYRDNLFLCQFNLRKVSRHVLRPSGSSYASKDSDFVTSDNVDFHPTDVVVDADGSLLVIDTGGWYKLCCPTSQLWKPDVLGGIYRVRRVDGVVPEDPRGLLIDWPELSIKQLWELLSDKRPDVRRRATREFVARNDSHTMPKFLAECIDRGAVLAVSDVRTTAIARTWALAQLERAVSRALVRQLLSHPDEQVRHAAIMAISLHRDTQAVPQLTDILTDDTAANRRAAAEALGRMRKPSAVPYLLTSAATAEDRILQHSITYALIELAAPAATAAGTASDSPRTVAAALVALDQMPSGGIAPDQVIPLLDSADETLRATARWLAMRHPEWGEQLAHWFSQKLANLPEDSDTSIAANDEAVLEPLLVAFASDSAIQQLIGRAPTDAKLPKSSRGIALAVMAQARLSESPESWRAALGAVVEDGDQELVPLAIAAAREVTSFNSPPDALGQSLLTVVDNSQLSRELRVAALAVASRSHPKRTKPQFDMLIESLSSENPLTLRSSAADAVSQSRLTRPQLDRLCKAIESAGPLELHRLLAPFAHSNLEPMGLRLLAALERSSALSSLRVSELRDVLAKYPAAVQQGVDKLQSIVNVDAAAQRERIETLLPQMARGDIRRGHAVFHSSKAACSACHRLGHAGGIIGPELTTIGQTRTERDLLESILFPSLSFVQSYESVLIITTDGRAINGTIRDETAEEYVLAIGVDQETRLRRDDVEELVPSTVSIMPAGLDQQLTVQELADLVAFLKNAKGE